MIVPHGDIQVALINGIPNVRYPGGYAPIEDETPMRINGYNILFKFIRDREILNPSIFWRSLIKANSHNCIPVFWNVWDDLDIEKSERIVQLMWGRTIEICAPIILSDNSKIYWLTAIANRSKAVHKFRINKDEVKIRLDRAWGLDSAFKFTYEHLRNINKANLRNSFMQKYKQLL